MSNTAQMPDYFALDTSVYDAVNGLDAYTKTLAHLLSDPYTAEKLKERSGDIIASRARLGNVIWEITGGKQV